MLKRLFLTLIFSSFLTTLFSWDQQPKVITIPKDKWTQVVQYSDDVYVIPRTIKVSSYPSFIITKSVEYTKMGYLIKIWIASNTRHDGIINKLAISDIIISYYNGKYMQNIFNIKFIVVSGIATQVSYFLTQDPDAQVQFKWGNIKIERQQ